MQNASVIVLALSFKIGSANAFESTKVLPKGIRNVNIKSLHTQIGEIRDQNKNIDPLAQPLNKGLKFKDILKSKSDSDKGKLSGFYLDQGFELENSAGDITADIKADLTVVAPVISYGVTDQLTLAIAIPYFSGRSDVAVGFRANREGQRFVSAFVNPVINNPKAAREAAEKFNDFEAEINEKLTDNGYETLGPWQGEGVGDITLAAKYRYIDSATTPAALTFGVVAPTGDVDDPDIISDLGFGDGTWDIFSTLAFDQRLSRDLFINEYVKYTYQMLAHKTVRLKTEEESLEVEKKKIGYKLGDKTEAGLSLQYEPQTGFLCGLGYVYERKLGDDYDYADREVVKELSKDTDSYSHSAEAMIGYSTVPAFRRKQMSVPFSFDLNYKYQIIGRNTPITSFVGFNANLYF